MSAFNLDAYMDGGLDGVADTGELICDTEDWPVHQPAAPEAPIPGRHWYGGCSPDYGRVNPDTGVCMDCGETACATCGREDCPDHGDAA